MSDEYPALVSYPPNPGPNWKVENVKVSRSPDQHELKVRMLATGICHSDIVVASIPDVAPGTRYPRILGHEGAGIVEEVGPGVTVAKVGDPVLLSYNFCRNCDLCNNDHQANCMKWMMLNAVGAPGNFETLGGQDVNGNFFGQSSFAGGSIVKEGSVVNVKDMVKDQEELKLLAPLGCGMLTGSGALLNAADPKSHDIVMVTGVGGVGLAAIMAAKLAGCKEIIAVDKVASRLEVAKELGATKVINTSQEGSNLAKDTCNAVQGQRISYVIETTGAIPVITAAMEALGKRGKHIQVGVPPFDSELTLPLSKFFTENKTFECCYLGDTTGQIQIPKMIQWYHEGKFPIDKIVKFFPAKDALQALQGMEDGSAIKPVIVW
ncbi:hypothetical protein H2202_006718 [Exophiala xenobiotica]|nr:hypothetical protein H2202_006718 [Exophiala xenobiotica]